MNKLKDFMKTRLGSVIVIAAEFIIGILLLVNPVGFTGGIIKAAGILLLLLSVFWIVSYFREPIQVGMEKRNLAKGLICLIGGLFCLAGTDWIIAVFPTLTMMYGVFLLVHSLYKVQTTADLARLHRNEWKLSAIFTGLTMILAWLILFNPFGTVIAVWTLVGISYIAVSVMNLIQIFLPGVKVR